MERCYPYHSAKCRRRIGIFAAHNSDLGPNGHKYRRDESVELQPLSQRFLDSYLKNGSYTEADFNALEATFGKMVESGDVLMTNTGNRPLIVEMMPWLRQFKLLGETGQEVLAMAKAYKKGTTHSLSGNTVM